MKNGLAIYAGGNHIFYILGVLKYFFERRLKFDAIGTYSAGAGILPFLIDGNFERAIDIFARHLDKNSRNIYWQNIFTRERVFPHDEIYRRTISEIINYEKTIEYDKPLRVVVSEFKSRIFGDSLVGVCAFVALLLNRYSKKTTPSIFLTTFKSVFSVKGDVIDIRKCKSKDDILNVILGSSTIYPFIQLRRRGGNTMLDGKMSLMSPVDILEDCENVLSIHAHHTFLTQRNGLVSVFPINKVKVGPLNYVGSSEIKSGFAQGYEEGKQLYERLKQSPFF